MPRFKILSKRQVQRKVKKQANLLKENCLLKNRDNPCFSVSSIVTDISSAQITHTQITPITNVQKEPSSDNTYFSNDILPCSTDPLDYDDKLLQFLASDDSSSRPYCKSIIIYG